MAESSRRVAPGNDNSLEALWLEHNNLAQQSEELASDVHRIYGELRQELRDIKARLERLQPVRTTVQMAGTATRREIEQERQRQRGSQIIEASDSEEELHQLPPFRNLELSDSEEEVSLRRRRRPRGADRPHGEFKVKLDIPYFDGKLHIEDFLDWERAIETFFEYMEIEPEKQVKYVACRIKGGASAWWQQVLQTRRREGKGQVRNWPKMKQLLRGHYLPTDYEQMLYLQYQHCVQGNRSVNDYTEEFYRLSARNNLNESTNQLVARYIGGLREAIQDKLELNTIWSLSQAVNYAIKEEMQLSRHTRGSQSRRNSETIAEQNRFSNSVTPTSNKQQIATQAVNASYNPGNRTMEHKGVQKGKLQTKENLYVKPTNIKCFRCLQQGHKSNECPTRPHLQFAEAEIEDGVEENEEALENSQEDVVGDEGEQLICVMEKLLLAPKQPNISQRNALFRTKCTIGGKVCELLIDSGCTENVVSRAMVQALQLKTTKSSNPYKISWVKKGLEMTVTEQCRVSFSIGKHYASEVLCDVLDMDVCHIILGRPWQYDVGAIYDCRANTYAFDWKGRRLRLLPSSSGHDPSLTKNKTALFFV
ncbi:hypothetical protein KFK09_000060 [Dendrobium nobile]|uniref:CCHC-type domain-containing protein n=1 Tax=Dendrobium nobile TaxID=94219 RepID=A0A8T3CA18_DENNO|nr:hypothetical protein KFK09_000060 [Dendrobium nobile]